MTTGTMTSTRVVGSQAIESKVTRAGEIVHVDLINQRGDRLRASLDHEGNLKVEAEQNGRVVALYGSETLTPTGA
jgi:hypothetical protein